MAPDLPSPRLEGLVGLGGVEPPTSPLSGVRSDQLSYRPGFWLTVQPGQSRVNRQTGNLSGNSRQPEAEAESFKGGDPAARSRTATLLRLHPSH
jgi:hypothetical protein